MSARRLFDKFQKVFKDSNQDMDYKVLLNEEAKKNIERINRQHGLRSRLRFNLDCVQSRYENIRPNQIRQCFFHTYFLPLDLALSTLLNNEKDSAQAREQLQIIEILPYDGETYAIYFTDSTLRIRRSFEPRLTIGKAGAESFASEIYQTIRKNLLIYD
jgi:hypothetical protein